jgi:mediator of RNA polymerase II transcription subunit 12
VDTLNYHFDSFNVIGAMIDLWRSSLEAWSRVKRSGLPARELVYSLVELGLRLPTETNMVTVLRQELFRLDCRSTLAASSPVSDHMVDTLSSEKRTSNEDIDQLLSSAIVIEESTLTAVFGTLCRRLELSGTDGKSSASDTCRYLVQLRSFNPKYFDILLIKWIGKTLKSTSRTKLSKILVPLVGVGCVTFKGFFALARKLMQPESSVVIPDAVNLRLELLELLRPLSPTQRGPLNLVRLPLKVVSGISADSGQVAYRFQIAQQEFLLKNSQETLDMVQDTSDYLGAHASPENMETNLSSFHACTISLLCDLLVRNPQFVAERYVQKRSGQSQSATSAVQKALNLLLGFNEHSGTLRYVLHVCSCPNFH